MANSDNQNPISLSVLFNSGLNIDIQALQTRLRSYDPEMASATVSNVVNQNGNLYGKIQWGSHIIDIAGISAPYPKQVLDACIPPSHYAEPLKKQAYDNQAHVILYHNNAQVLPIERCAALAACCGVLTEFGGYNIVNEIGHTSLPAGVFNTQDLPDDHLDFLREFPIPMIYVGFVKYNLPGTPKVWMRTHGAYALGAPDLAMITSGHNEGERTSNLFNDILSYMLSSGATLSAGHTMTVGKDNLRFRNLMSNDPEQQSETPLLVVERIAAGEINQAPKVDVSQSGLQTLTFVFDVRELRIDEMTKLQTVERSGMLNLQTVTLGSKPDDIVVAIDTFIKDTQKSQRGFLNKLFKSRPKNDVIETADGLGALLGNQIVKRHGWQWRYVSQQGRGDYAVVSPDAAVVIYPVRYISQRLSNPNKPCEILAAYQKIAAGRLPVNAPTGYFDILR